MTYKTRTCHSFSHPEIEACVKHPEWFREQLVDATDNLERCVAAGLRLEEGPHMACGWMPINIARLPTGNLIQEEPDFRSMPIRWLRRLDRCFEHFRIQMKMIESAGLGEQVDFARLDLAAVVGRDFLDATMFRIRREEPEQARDSGWIFEPIPSRLDYEADPAGTLLFQSLYETALIRPEIIPFMALPIGSEVRIAPDGELEVFFDQEKLTLKQGTNLRDYTPREVD